MRSVSFFVTYEKNPTLRDVAQLAGVSKATAARVVSNSNEPIREETRHRVNEAVRQLGYERHAIAGSLRSARTRMIALSIPDIANPFWPQVARGVQDKLEESDFTVVMLNSDWNSRREHMHLRRMGQKQFDGLIINPTSTLNDDLLKLRYPVVVLSQGDGFPDFDTVASDSSAGVRLALEHLLERGHRRIGLTYLSGRSIEGKKHYNPPRDILGERQPYYNHLYTPAAEQVVIVEFQTDSMMIFAGRETGEFARDGQVIPLAIRTSRVVQCFDGEVGWRQVHHHGSIDNADALAQYQRAVRGE